MSEVRFIPRETIHKIKMQVVQGVVNCERGEKYSQCIKTDHLYILVITYCFSFKCFTVENAMLVS